MGEKVVISFNNQKIIEKKVSKFGNGAHLLVSKEFIGQKLKVVSGKRKISGGQIELDLFEGKIIDGKVSKFGTGAHVIVPKEYVEEEVILIGGENE